MAVFDSNVYEVKCKTEGHDYFVFSTQPHLMFALCRRCGLEMGVGR